MEFPRQGCHQPGGFLFCFSGVVAVASSFQLIYEPIFGQQPRGWRNLPRGILWIVAWFFRIGGVIVAGAVLEWNGRRTPSAISGLFAPAIDARSSGSCGAFQVADHVGLVPDLRDAVGV